MQKIHIGSVYFGQKVIVSDPCYKIYYNDLQAILDVTPGTYNIYVEKLPNDSRPVALCAEYAYSKGCGPYELVAEGIGVDSGMAGIYDYKAYERYVNLDKQEHDDIYDSLYDEDNYARIVKKLSGAVSSTYYDDGSYPVIAATNIHGRIEKIRIEYFSPDDQYDDEDEDEWNDDDEY